MKYVLEYKGEKIEYNVERKAVKNINLRVTPSGIFVSANRLVPQSVIDEFVLNNADRILSAVRKINRKISVMPTFESGSRIKLLGNEYALEVIEGEVNAYSIGNTKIIFYVSGSESFENREAVYKMLLLDVAKTVFPKLLKECYPEFEKYCAGMPELHIKYLKSQWGNCYQKKNILTLNSRLAAFNENVIRSVIYHEYCHFVHPNHSKDFYNLLNTVMPEWKKYDRELKK